MSGEEPSQQQRRRGILNVLELEAGDQIRLKGDVTAAVVSNPRDGMWVLVRYLSHATDPAKVGSEELAFAEDIVEVL